VHFSLSDLVADITQNGAESGASLLELEIRETVAREKSEFRFIAADNGKGMTADELDRAMDPFVTDGVKHPGRRVGLGIPFLVQTALQSGGGYRISSARAAGGLVHRYGGTGHEESTVPAAGVPGTAVEAWFDLANVDTPPMGDIPGLFRTVLLFSGPAEIVLKRRRIVEGNSEIAALDYEVTKTELMEALGDLEDVSSLVLLGKYLRSLEGEENE
jgi:hypothetical protein